MKAKSLAAFIKEYLKANRLTDSDKGYAAFLAKNGVGYERELEDSLYKAERDYLISKSRIGSTAEKRSGAGLTGSGYGGYLADLTKRNTEADRTIALAKFLGADPESHVKFTKENEAREKALAKKREAEEKKLEKAKATAYNAAKKGIETAGMVDYTRAYEYALSMGVDDESARALAKSTTTVARDAAIEKIVKMIFNRRLTRDQAEEYASGLGLSDNDVKDLGDIAEKANQSVKDMASQKEYLEYLKNKNNSN